MARSDYFMKNAFTLVELILVVSFISIITLSILAFITHHAVVNTIPR